MKWQLFRGASMLSAILVVSMCLGGGSLFAQGGAASSSPAPNSGSSPASASSSSAAPATQASSAPSASTSAPAAPPAAAGQKPSETKPPAAPVPGFDAKRGLPLYETIQEDWSSLQIGVSKLDPQPPMIGGVDDQPTFTRIMARVQWRPGDPIDLYIFMPKGVKKPPVVLYLYSPTDSNRFMNNDWATRVTEGGVAAVGFNGALMGPRFHDRPMKQWFISELQESLGSTVHDVKLILDYLDQSGQMDTSRVGMFGEGVGGSIAILAAAADSRIKVVDTLEPWGDWPVFLTKSPAIMPDPNHEEFGKPEFLKKVAPLEPAKWLAELKVPIRIQQVKESETMPEECKDAIKAAAPKQAQVNRFVSVRDLTRLENGGKLFQWVKDNLPKSGEPAKTGEVKTSVAEKTSPEKAAAQR